MVAAYPPAVVLGMSPTGLAVVRSLGRKGITVIGVDSDSWAVGHFSKYVRFASIASNSNWEETLFETLLSIGSSCQEKPVLFCSEDVYLLFMARYAHKLRENYRMPSSLNSETINLFLDKEKFYKMCFERGVELPATYWPKDIEEVEALAVKVPYPCVIKPSFGHLWRKKLRGKKMVEVHTQRELITRYRQLSSWDNRLVIQEVIPGGDNSIYIFEGSFDRNSEPLAVFTGRKLRQFPPRFGSASLAESIWIPKVAEMSLNLLKTLGFHGICGTEFKKDPRDGNFKIIEINPRPELWSSLIEASGIDLIYTTYRDLIGAPIPQSRRQEDGIKWLYTERDIPSSFYYLWRGGLTPKSWLRSLRGKKVHAVFAGDDPWVVALLPFNLIKELWQQLICGG